jgi:hypothetical protein
MPPSAPSPGHLPSIHFDSAAVVGNSTDHDHDTAGRHNAAAVVPDANKINPAPSSSTDDPVVRLQQPQHPPPSPPQQPILPYDSTLIPYGQNYANGFLGQQPLYSSPAYSGYGGGTGGMYGAAAGGGGMYGAGYGGPIAGLYGGYGAGGMMAGGIGGPLSNLNQLLFGVQNVIFSLTQAVQIIGLNTEAVQKLLEAATAKFDHAIGTWREMQALEDAARTSETEDDRKRRRRLRALRWAFTTAVTYAAYAIVRHGFAVLSRRRNFHASSQPRLMPQQQQQQQQQSHSDSAAWAAYR